MTRWGIGLLIAAGLAIGLAFGYYLLHRNDDRFGDPAVLQQIESSTDCDKLRQWADQALADMASSDHEAADQAIGYSNAANDRLEELDCQ